MTDAPVTTGGARRRGFASLPILGGLAIIALLAIGGGAWLAFGGGRTAESGSQSEPSTIAAAEAYDSGDFASAEEALAGLVEADEGDLEARKALALALAAQGKNDEALEQYAAIIAADPKDHESLYQMAVLERLLGKTPDAITHFEAALAAKDDPVYADELARTYMQAGRYDDAIAQWQAVLEAGGLDEAGQAAIYAAMASAHEGARRYEDARAALEQALFLLPNDTALAARLAGYGD